MVTNGLTNQLLGYPPDARLLIINADDFGMCHSVNKAIIGTFQAELVHPTTLMVPCPWGLHAMLFLANHPKISFGVHLPVISEWTDYQMGPVTPREKASSFHTRKRHNLTFLPEVTQLKNARREYKLPSLAGCLERKGK